MPNRLAIVLLGERNSGKSSAWEALFHLKKVPSGIRSINLDDGVQIIVKMMNASSEERGEPIEVRLLNASNEELGKSMEQRKTGGIPQVLLCSVGYEASGRSSLSWIIDHDYTIKLWWLNPGANDGRKYFDYEGLAPFMLASGATLRLRKGGKGPHSDQSKIIAQEIREALFGWATYHYWR